MQARPGSNLGQFRKRTEVLNTAARSWAHSLMVDFDDPLVQEILDVLERQPKPDVEDYRQSDYLQAHLEVADIGAFCDSGKQEGLRICLRLRSHDS
jgi:hypothetical protein